MQKTISKFNLFNALANGLPLAEIGANVVCGVEREDGSNQSYNVHFLEDDVIIFVVGNKY